MNIRMTKPKTTTVNELVLFKASLEIELMLVLIFVEKPCIGVDLLRSREASSELNSIRGNVAFRSVLQTHSDKVTRLHSLFQQWRTVTCPWILMAFNA